MEIVEVLEPMMASGFADPGRNVVLDLEDLGNSFIDKIGVNDSFLNGARGGEVLVQRFGGVFGEQSFFNEVH